MRATPNSFASDAATPLTRTKKNRFRSQSLRAAATAAVVTGGATEAVATIIPGTGSFSAGDTFSIDGTSTLGGIEIVAMGGMNASLSLEASMGMMGDPDSTVEFAFFSSGTGMDQADYLSAFQANGSDTVGDSLPYVDEAFMLFANNENPDWGSGTTAYVGFRFDPGSGFVYGWVKIDYLGSGTDLTVSEWAYQSDVGVAIVVPEPGTALLLGLGLAGLAVAGRRIRHAAILPAVGAHATITPSSCDRA